MDLASAVAAQLPRAHAIERDVRPNIGSRILNMLAPNGFHPIRTIDA
jgi:hypothetical protein